MNETQTRRMHVATLAGLLSLSLFKEAYAVNASSSPAPSPSSRGSGRVGDFDFLAGEWKIKHRRLKTPGGGDWDEFEGEATCWTILAGVGSVEELRIPARNFSGMGLRLLDVEKRVWSDFWVNAKSGVLTAPGMPGHFIGGEGIFIVDAMEGERKAAV